MKRNIMLPCKVCLCLTVVSFLVSCTESIEDKAAREAKEYTEKFCPTPVISGSSTDSTVFERSSKTYIYYMTLSGNADRPDVIAKNRKLLHDAQKHALDNNPGIKKYKEAGINFRFVYRSASHKDSVLLDETFKYNL